MLRSDSAGQSPRTSDVHYLRITCDSADAKRRGPATCFIFAFALQRILLKILGDHFSCFLGDIGSLSGLNVLGIHYAHDLKADLSAFPGVVLRDLFRTLDRQDNDRDIRSLLARSMVIMAFLGFSRSMAIMQQRRMMRP